jgi:hypothetical protein
MSLAVSTFPNLDCRRVVQGIHVVLYQDLDRDLVDQYPEEVGPVPDQFPVLVQLQEYLARSPARLLVLDPQWEPLAHSWLDY